ncbi:cuticle protein 65-like isoform X1 [Aricia agestis]|uniref:cuticle protein 65-like isoform X1 n=1 Tax=Aricia agestis TaxID=91739 RepID=UPI001C20B60D|nr:cuticle protein 65-like isoform X1 [Aricia agestis]
MQSLVVFLAVAAVARASLLPLAQPAHHPAIVLDPHGRPLDTAEVIGARALHYQAKALEPHGHIAHAAIAAPIAHAAIAHVAPAVIAAPAAVSHQSRVDVRTSPAVVAHSVVAAPIAHGVHGVHGLHGW